jgi:hypothetical protein
MSPRLNSAKEVLTNKQTLSSCNDPSDKRMLRHGAGNSKDSRTWDSSITRACEGYVRGSVVDDGCSSGSSTCVTVQIHVAGVGSTFPASSFALTSYRTVMKIAFEVQK